MNTKSRLAAGLLSVATTTGIAVTVCAPASAVPQDADIKISKKVTIIDSGSPNYSTVLTDVTIRCEPNVSSGFYVFVSQPQAPGSFGFVTATCDGKKHRYTVSTSSNFGTLYEPGLATVNVTNFSVGAQQAVTLSN